MGKRTPPPPNGGTSPVRGGTICAKCGKPLPPDRMICPCRGDLCGHIWDFRGLDHDEGGKKYFRYTCLRCGEKRVEPVSSVRNMYAAKLEE